ncbi:MAG TPA: hypothetical protein VGD37_04065 [Kofleriaceae bacterium]
MEMQQAATSEDGKCDPANQDRSARATSFTVGSAYERRIERWRSNSRRDSVMLGTLMIAIGIAITAATFEHASSGGGTFILAYGPIIGGLIAIMRGLFGR